jgi:hypothetical protein
MKNAALLLLTVLGLTVSSMHNAKAGSAVAFEPHSGKMVNSSGHPEQIAIQKAMAEARHLYGPNVRILAATDVTGYCAVGVAGRVGKTAIVGVALGQKSAADAQAIVLDQLYKAGGIKPKIISRWRG